MRRRRRRLQIINRNINDIDYDKLAEAIVKATNSQNSSTENKDNEPSMSFWKAAYYIIFKKGRPSGMLVSNLLGGILSIAFNILAFLGALFIVLGIPAIVLVYSNVPWTAGHILGNLIGIVFIAFILFIVALYSLLLRGAACEMAEEKDRNYVVAVFSSVVSFAALVVALIALLRGVQL